MILTSSLSWDQWSHHNIKTARTQVIMKGKQLVRNKGDIVKGIKEKKADSKQKTVINNTTVQTYFIEERRDNNRWETLYNLFETEEVTQVLNSRFHTNIKKFQIPKQEGVKDEQSDGHLTTDEARLAA